MTAAQLLAVAARTQAEATAALAKLDTVDLETLPPLLRAEYESVRGGWLKLLSMTADEVVDLHIAACDVAGPQLGEDGSKGRLTKR
jgi:hypothetical protein